MTSNQPNYVNRFGDILLMSTSSLNLIKTHGNEARCQELQAHVPNKTRSNYCELFMCSNSFII